MSTVVVTRLLPKSYAARITAGKNTGLHRDWCDRETRGTKDGSPGAITFTLDGPGWFEYREGAEWHRECVGKRYLRVTEDTVERLDGVTIVDMVVAVGGPLPGSPGEWRGDMCECGTEIFGYDQDGFPHCATHMPAPVATVDPDMPVTA